MLDDGTNTRANLPATEVNLDDPDHVGRFDDAGH
jgi:hypothetical protein